MTDSKNLQPLYVPIKCVVCNGFGSVNWGKAECHACKGKGYILVPAKEQEKDENENNPH